MTRMVVLVSAAASKGDGRPIAVRSDAQAVALALSVSAEVTALHAGDPASPALSAYAGLGRVAVEALRLPPGADALGALAWRIADLAPDLVLTGPRSGSGAGTGMLPYALAAHLGWPVLASICALTSDGDGLEAHQAEDGGARRRVGLAGRAVLVADPAAPPPPWPAFRPARDARIRVLDPPPETHGAAGALRLRPAARRPGALGPFPGGPVSERLDAVMGAARPRGQLLRPETPEAAAQAILDFLGRAGGRA